MARFVSAHVPVGVPVGVPVDLSRDEARELARQELSKPSYERDVSLTTRIFRWVLEQVERLLDSAAGVVSSRWGVAAIVLVVLALALAIVLRTGPMARRAALSSGAVFAGRRRTAAEYDAAADAAADRADWDTAVVERYRAVVARLEERGVLPPQSGRTADEAAREAGDVLVELAGALGSGATLFDAVRYGGRSASRDDHEVLRTLRRAVDVGRPTRSDRSDGASPVLAAPR